MSENNLNKEEKAQLNRLHTMAEELMNNSYSPGNNRDIRRAMSMLMSGTYDSADTLHNIYLDFGYPLELKFYHFWNMYRRFGIARNVVDLPVDTCWTKQPIVIGSDQFNREFERFAKRTKLWVRAKGLDRRQRLGRYAGMFMRVRDGKMPSEKLEEGSLNGESMIMGMMPLYESQLEVIESDTDPMSENYGNPTILQYRQGAVGSRNEEAQNSINIHASRIVFNSEYADDGWIYGIPVLEPVYNSLMDLRKIIGSGGEGFYKNAAQATVFDLKDTGNAAMYEEKLKRFNDEYDDFIKNRSRRGLWTPGMEAKTLQSDLASPKEHFEAALADVAAGGKIAATILIGKQTGRLASTEDSRQFLSVCQSRNENHTVDLIMSILDWCMLYGALPTADYTVEFDDLLARSDEEKLESGKSMSQINKDQFMSGGEVPFSGEDIREVSGFEPDDMPDQDIDDPDESIDDDIE